MRVVAVNSNSATKNLGETLFAPAKAIVGVLDAFGDVHPAIKVVAVVVKVYSF